MNKLVPAVWILIGFVGCASEQPETERTLPSLMPVSSQQATPSKPASSAPIGGSDMISKPADTPREVVEVVLPPAGLEDGECAGAKITAERIRPRVVFLVDSSSSMREDFGGPTRWDALRDALLSAEGVVPKLEQLVKFGLITYAGPRFTTCPAYQYAAPAASNLTFVTEAFPGAPPDVSSTPTGEAMDWAIDNAFVEQIRAPDVKWEPQFMIFATDGEPNGCAEGAMGEPVRDFASVIAAAHKAAGRGIKIYVLSLAEASGEFADHLAEVAQIGETDQVYSPQNKQALVDELLEIVGAAISCEVELSGQIVEGKECEGNVFLNDEMLECGGADGWELVDAGHIQFNGKACDDFRLAPEARVRASFPCDAIE